MLVTTGTMPAATVSAAVTLMPPRNRSLVQ
jgi:hypothetical protein